MRRVLKGEQEAQEANFLCFAAKTSAGKPAGCSTLPLKLASFRARRLKRQVITVPYCPTRATRFALEPGRCWG